MLANVMHRTDMGVVQGGGGAGLALEPLQALRILDKLPGQELEGHAAAEAGILGLVDDPHAAASQWLELVVVGDGLADRDRAWFEPVGACHPWARLCSLHPERPAASRAVDLSRRGCFGALDGVLAMGTDDVHGKAAADQSGDTPILP